jgi:putative ABC transport system permease protein
MSEKKYSLWSLRFFRSFCPPHLLEEIEGDLIQKFNRDVKDFGEGKAKRRLLWNVIRFCRPGIIMRRKNFKPFNAMLINNLKFTLRHLRMQKVNSFIHVFGLALGMIACLLITVFIHHEKSFDSYHAGSDKIFRVNSVWKESEKQFNLYATPLPLAEALRKEVPQIKFVARVLPQFRSLVSIGDGKSFKQERILIAEPEFLDLFQVNILKGDGRSALKTPYQAIISESIADKFFGEQNPIGKSFRFRNEFDVTVAAVMRDLPPQTNLPASILLSFVDNEAFLNNGDTWYFGGFAWTKLQASTYVMLEEEYQALQVNELLKTIADKNINASSELDKTIQGSFELQPLKEIHFDTDRFGGGPWVQAISNKWLWVFGLIGSVILTLACINFLNLSIAQSITRAKEVSVRKLMGADRVHLIIQFLTEPCLLTLMAGVVSIVSTLLLLPFINEWLDKDFTFQILQSQNFLL